MSDMWVLDGDKLRQYWDDLAVGFQKSPLELTIHLILIGLIIVVPIVIYLIVSRRGRARSRAEGMARFQAALAAKGLGRLECDALTAMAAALSADPSRWVDVLTRAASFNVAAGRIGDRHEDALLGRLRFLLGYRATGGSLHSTVELENGDLVTLRIQGHDVRARVAGVDADGFDVVVTQRVPAGGPVTIQIARANGLFQAQSRIQSLAGNKVRLLHVEVGDRVQNRRFLRRRVHGAVGLTLSNGSEARMRLIDLSGGGARLENSEGIVRLGDEVTLILGTKDGSKLNVPSRVVRVTPKSFSLTFKEISEIDRDRLIKRLG